MKIYLTNSKRKNMNDTHGTGFFGLLTVVFITLKLIDEIDWSWWWVLSPIWIPFVIVGLIAIIGLILTQRDI